LILNLAALLLVAVVLRVWRLGTIAGINGDEAWTAVQATRWLNGEQVLWRTPNGNPLNPFYMLPTLALHALLPPSFTVLRTTALVSGLLALVANFALCRRAYDLRTAVLSTWILALLPIDIAYSRFAWDASQSLLATVLVLYLPLLGGTRHRPSGGLSTLGIVALAGAILVHPTNVFAAPLLAVPALVTRRHQIVAAWENTTIPARGWNLAGLVALSVAAVYAAWKMTDLASHRLHGPSSLGHFTALYLQLFSGTTVYAFISGATLPNSGAAWRWLASASDLFCLALVLTAAWGWVRRLREDVSQRGVCLLLGWAAMVLGFFLVAGPEALAPHAERYGICLLAPAALVAARGLAWWLEQQSSQRLAAAAYSIFAWWWPISFALGYFVYFLHTGGTSHATFRTAAVEPKLQAWRLIERARPAGEAAQIVCQEFWNYWPLAYLAAGDREVRVLTWDEWQELRGEGGRGSTWFVEYAGTAAERRALEIQNQARTTGLHHVIYDNGGRPLLSVSGGGGKLFTELLKPPI
jgi:hypothetical protein